MHRGSFPPVELVGLHLVKCQLEESVVVLADQPPGALQLEKLVELLLVWLAGKQTMMTLI